MSTINYKSLVGPAFLRLLLMGAAALLLLNNCTGDNAPKQAQHCYPIDTLPVKYAKGFRVEYYNGFKVITMMDAGNSAKILAQYVIYPKGKTKPLDFKKANAIQTPLGKAVCLSTTQIGMLDPLGLLDSIGGVTDGKRIFHPYMQQLLQSGKIKSLGVDGNIDYEQLVQLKPEIILAYSFNEGSNSQAKLEALHQHLFLVNDFNEKEPLARAEWIKCVAALYDKEQLADSIFNYIEAEYIAARQLAAQATNKPTVFCNMPWGGIWYLPSGRNYFTNFIEDANGDYLWKEDTSSRTLNLDVEAVMLKALNADIWINPNEAVSLQEMKQQSNKFTLFKAYKEKQVYNNNARQTKDRGLDFWESGTMNPHLILKDLIKIFHPELLPNDTLTYYKRLPDA
jgi:iron complex transport system substrate-binding protein